MALLEIDRSLLERCLARGPRAWEDFVDRFMGLVLHVINHTAQSRSIRLSVDDRDDLAAEVLLAFVKDDFAVLRHFRGQSSLATYLTVVARRVVVHQLLRRRPSAALTESSAALDHAPSVEQRISDRDEVVRLLDELEGLEAEVVRLYHLEGRSYGEISHLTGRPENSIGPTLTRARQKLRRAAADQAAH